MEPSMTTIRVGPRIDLYGSIPVDIFCTIMNCLLDKYPNCKILNGDPYKGLLCTIELSEASGDFHRKENAPCLESIRRSGIPSTNSQDGSTGTAPTAGIVKADILG